MKKICNNKKARYEYYLLFKIIAGIKLLGMEIKSIRKGNVNINNSYCVINNGNVYVINMYIKKYKYSNYNPYFIYKEYRNRRLLLNKNEIYKLNKFKGKNNNYTIIPLLLFITNKGLAKLKISLAKGKKLHDKRETIKKRDLNRKIIKKININKFTM